MALGSGRAKQAVAVAADVSIRQQMLRGVGWSAAQSWLLRLTTLGSFILLGRLLEPSDFGLVSLGSAFVSVLYVVTEGGFSSFLVQRAELDAKTTSTAFWTALAVSVGCAGLIVAASPLLALAFHEPGLTSVLMVLSIGLPLVGLSSVQSALLQRELKFRSVAVRQITATLSSTVVVIVLALLGAGVWALVAQSLVNSFVATVMLWRASTWRPSFIWDRAQAGTMISFSWKVLSGNLLTQFRDRAEQFIIAGVGGSVLLGYWTIATRIIQILMEMSVSVIQKVMLPGFAKLKSDPPRLRRAYRTALTYTAVLVVPVMVLCSQTSYAVIPLVFGNQWIPSAQVAAIMAISALGASMNYYDRAMYLAHGRPGIDLAMTASIVPLHVVIVLLTAPHGLVWVAVGTVFRTYLVWPVRLAVLKKVCALPWSSYTGMLPLFLVALPTIGVMQVLRRWAPDVFDGWGCLLLAAVGAITYAFLAVAASRDVRQLIRSLQNRLSARRTGAARAA